MVNRGKLRKQRQGDGKLERLLRAAAGAPDEAPAMPFGFDTRVLAHWRLGADRECTAILRLLRRATLVSLGIIVLGSAGTYRELNNDDPAELLSEDEAIADSAVGAAFDQ
jgi:hypothetical protein